MKEFPMHKKEASSHTEDASLNNTIFSRNSTPSSKESFANEAILTNKETKKTVLSLLSMLQLRDLTEKEARDKLLKKEYEEENISLAIDYAKSFGYMGDSYYCGKYYDTYRERKSQRRMEQDLLNKGVSKDIIQEIFANKSIEYKDEEDPEIQQIYSLLQKKGYNKENIHSISYQESAKLYAFLLRKGYSSSKIHNCMRIKNDFPT